MEFEPIWSAVVVEEEKPWLGHMIGKDGKCVYCGVDRSQQTGICPGAQIPFGD